MHSNAYISDVFAKNFAATGMKAYVEFVQRREREIGSDVLTHQRVRGFPTFWNSANELNSGVVRTMLIV